MNMSEWAERECRIACKRENPDFNFDSNDFAIRCDNRASNLRWVTPKENANNETTKLNRKRNKTI